MILPRPMPLTSVSTISNASMPGCASRKSLASPVVEPEGDEVMMPSRVLALLSCRKPFDNLSKRRDQPAHLGSGRGRREQHHVVEGRDQDASIDQSEVDR